jgi:hypothetical protein
MSPRVTLQALKILRLLSKDFENLEKIQGGKKLRLSNQLIYTFRWLDNKNLEDQASPVKGPYINPGEPTDNAAELVLFSVGINQKISDLDLIYREISKTF